MKKDVFNTVVDALCKTENMIDFMAPYFNDRVVYQTFTAYLFSYHYKQKWPKAIVLNDVPYGINQFIDVLIINGDTIVYVKTRISPLQNILATVDKIKKSISQSDHEEIKNIQKKEMNEYLFYVGHQPEEIPVGVEYLYSFVSFFNINELPITVRTSKKFITYDSNLIPF